jgi:electron transfer flavoprotein beta subunit
VKIVVTVKLVPDPNAEKRLDPQSKHLVRSGVETVLNPYDEYALEAALQLRERMPGSTVTVFSMGPEALKETLRKALAMGADEAAYLSDPALEGSDVWTTSLAMSRALAKIGFDLLIVGGLTDDGSTGAVPGSLAEHLQIPCVTNARKVEIADNRLSVERETDTGYQTVGVPLPALLTTALTFGEPRYASLKGIMGAKKKTIAPLSVADLELDAPVGTSGSKVEIESFAPPPARGRGRVVEADDGAAGAAAIFEFLREKRLA